MDLNQTIKCLVHKGLLVKMPADFSARQRAPEIPQLIY